MTDLVGHISELKMMHEVSEEDIDAIVQPTVLFSHTEEIEIPELADAKTDPTENIQDNGTTLPVSTQTCLPHSPLKETLVALAETLPYHSVEAGDVALQVRTEDLLDVCLLVNDENIFWVYQDWFHQNTGEHLDGRIAEDGKWQASWKKLVCMPTQQYNILSLAPWVATTVAWPVPAPVARGPPRTAQSLLLAL